MRNRFLKLSVFVVLCAAFIFYGLNGSPASAFSTGPVAARTGAPNEPNCTVCHGSFAVNSGTGVLTISGLPATYTPNQEIPVTVTIKQANRSKYGFQATAIDDTGKQAGDLVVTDAARTIHQTGTGSGNLRQYMNHSGSGTAPNGTDQNSWTFTWKAPAQSVGRVTFYVAGNAANGNGSSSGDYIYTINQSIQPGAALSLLTSVSSASFAPTGPLAADSIASAFGTGLSQNTVVATTTPLPTQLDGTEVEVKDANNMVRNAGLFFVSAGQINYLIPAGTVNGTATVTVKRNSTPVAQGMISVETVSPAFFTANATGLGVPAAVILRRHNGVDTFESVSQFNAATSRYEAIPIDLGPESDIVVLLGFGTGFRNNTDLSMVNATIGGTPASVLFAGAQSATLAGLDQTNIIIPRSLIGRGAVDLVMNVAGKQANTVQLNIK